MTTTPQKKGPVRLHEGVTRGNLSIFFFACFMASGLMVYVSFSKGYLLSTFLGIPPAQQGQATGNLQAFREGVILFAIVLGGILADKLSRRLVFALGFAFLGLGYALFPLARNINQLLVFYVISGIGAAFITAMLSTVLADYVRNEDRGRAGGVQGALGAAAGVLLLPLFFVLPTLFGRLGLAPLDAGRASYYVLAGLAFAVALLAWTGWAQRAGAPAADKKSFGRLVAEGIGAARNPGVALAYAAAFVSRGDLVVVGAFTALWMNKAVLAQGGTPAQAIARSTPLILVGALTQIIAAPFIGRLTDRLDRASALMVATLIGVVAYSLMFFVRSPLDKSFLGVMAVLGVAQIAGLITSQVLIAQEAPEAIRGSVIGFFGLCGALSQIILVWIGGQLFDKWREAGPFLIVAALNLVLAIVAFLMRGHLKNRIAS
jgi:MFS family permease